MPWGESRSMELRAQFVFFAHEEDLSISELCERLLSKTLCQEVIGRQFGFKALLKHTDQSGAVIDDHRVGSGPFSLG